MFKPHVIIHQSYNFNIAIHSSLSVIEISPLTIAATVSLTLNLKFDEDYTFSNLILIEISPLFTGLPLC